MRIAQAGAKINAGAYSEPTKNAHKPDMIRISRPEDEDGHPDYYIQQSNFSARAAGVAAKHSFDNAPNVLTPWPLCSPELNVMDCAIWGMMDTAAGKRMGALSAKRGGAPPSAGSSMPLVRLRILSS